MIQFTNAGHTFKNGTVGLADINLKIDAGEFVYIVGESGAGKSTFAKLVLRELIATSGTIRVDGVDLSRIRKRRLPYYRRKIGFVFQNFRLLADRSAYENVAFACECIGLPRKQVIRRTREALEFVELLDRKDHYPHELSGGEQQRVAIARAIVNKPQIVIADEPTGNLDPKHGEEIFSLFEAINGIGTTVIMATHDEILVDKHLHRVVTLSDGRIVRDSMNGGYYLNVPDKNEIYPS
ncbi:MAG: ATP-binding cassette domain-containing protein [Peptococcaceae bacterium]|nr:ATP-binding cassette domain-containing protein [Peptococcaceae bacterium]